MYVGNLGSSISQTGWMPSRGGASRTTGVWASTDMETFSVWSDEVRNAKNSTVSVSLNCYRSAYFPQLDLHNNNLDIREPSVHTQARTWVTDYFVGCHASEETDLSVIVGSNEYVFFESFTLRSLSFIHVSVSHSRGDIALLRNADFHDRASNWSLERLWTGHHKGVVRSALLDERVSHPFLKVTLQLQKNAPRFFMIDLG